MIILAIDTSSSNCSAAISKDGELLANYNLNYEKQHSVMLMPILENMLKSIKLKIKDVDLFVTNVGPGSFTGLRIALSTLKAMALSMNKQLIAFNSFEVLAEPFIYSDKKILVIIDALRDTYYSALLQLINNKWTYIIEGKVRNKEDILELIEKYNDCILVGDGVKKIHFDENKYYSVIKANNFYSLSLASSLISLAQRSIDLKDISTMDETEILPIYMRKSQAEREYDLKMGIVD